MTKDFDYARRASTGLNWANPIDRLHIANNLLARRDELLDQGETSLESVDTLRQLSRVQDRLAICELAQGREFRARLREQEDARKDDRR